MTRYAYGAAASPILLIYYSFASLSNLGKVNFKVSEFCRRLFKAKFQLFGTHSF